MNVFDLVASIRLDTSEYDSALTEASHKTSNFSQSLSSIGSSVSAAGGELTKKLTLPIVGIGTAVIKTGMDYEAGMSKVQAISGATGAEMDMLGDKAMEMAAKTKFSTADSAEAYQYMAMAGWKANDMVDGLAGIMNLAAASGENLGVTSDIVTDALTAFGLTAADSGRFADVLAAASNNANTNVSMLGESFKYVAPVAGAMGYSVEDISTALGLMANSGIKASQAGTSLRTLLTNMAKPTDAMKDAMGLLNVSLTDGEGKMYSFAEIMKQLRDGFAGGTITQDEYTESVERLNEAHNEFLIDNHEYKIALEALEIALNGMSEAQQAEIAAMLAGKEGMSGLLAIVNTTEQDFNKLTGAINNSAGTTEKMASIMQDNAAGAFERLKSAVNVLFTQLAENLLPVFTSIVEKITAVVNWFGKLDPAMQKVILAIAGIAAVVGPTLIIVGKIITAISTISGALGSISGVIGTTAKVATTGITSVVGIGGKLIAGIKTVGTAISGLFSLLAANPIVLVIAAIAALVAAFVLLWNNCEGFRNFWIGLWDKIKSVVSTAVDAIKGFFGKIIDFIKGNWQGVLLFIVNPFVGAFKLIYDNCEGFREFWQNLFNSLKEAFAAFGDWLGEKIEAIKEFFGSLRESIEEKFSAIGEWFRERFTEAMEAVKSAWEGAKEFFAGVWQGIQEVFSAVGEFFSSVFSAAWEGIKAIWSTVKEFFSGVWEGIKEVFSTVKEVLSGFFSDAWTAIKEVWGKAKDFFAGVGEGIREVFSEVTEFLGNAFKAAWEAVKGAWDAAKEFFGGIWSSIKEKGEAAATAVGDALKGAWDKAKTAWDGAVSFFSGIKDKIVSVFKNLVNSAKTWGKDMLSNFVSGISEKAGAVVSKIKSVAQTVRDYIAFSEPKKGPLSDFHTYAPDMMKLFADGIAQSAGIVQRQLDKSLNFDFETRNLGFSAGLGGISPRNAQSAPQTAFVGAGGTTVNIYSPVAVDAIQAAREWKKTTQRMAMSYV